MDTLSPTNNAIVLPAFWTSLRSLKEKKILPKEILHIVPLGLILNKMLSNSFKYAFSRSKGQTGIYLHPRENTRILTASDDGPGFKQGFIAEKDGHLGIRLIRMLSGQPDGQVNFKQKNGIAYHITFPLNA